MNRTMSVLKMHSRDKWSWMAIPWSILFSSFIVNLIASLFVDDPIYTGGLGSLYIYMLVAGLLTMVQTFPFAIGFSVRRQDYYAGTVLMAVIVCICSALLLFVMALIEQGTSAWGTDLHFFSIPYLNAGPVVNLFWIPLSLLLNMYFLGFAISSVYRRAGRNGMFVLSGVALIAGTVISLLCTYYGWWMDIFQWMADQTAADYALWAIPFTVVYAFIARQLLRRATV